MPFPRILALLTALALLIPAGTAHADAHDPAAAEALFTEGRAAMKRGDYASAYAKFAESETLDPTALGTLLNLAECEEHLGKVASAWQHLRQALDQLPPQDDRIPYAQSHVTSLEAQLPKLTIRLAPGAPPATHVRRGEIEVGTASFGVPLPADPGSYDVVASAFGFASRHFTVELRPGAVTELEVDVGAPLAESPSAASSRWRTVGIVVGSVGIVGLGVGSATGVLAIERNSTVKADCSGGFCGTRDGVTAAQQGRTFATTSTATFIVGGVLVGAGIALILTHPKRGTPPPTSGVTVTPTGIAW
jgi:hypothetical protein